MPLHRYLAAVAAIAAALATASAADAACCYFSAQNTDILQPAQKVFITWDPVKKVETFTVQPKFEGNALDFGMVIPTPAEPKLDEMPKDFFKNLAVYSILMQREFPKSKLLPKGGKGGAKGGGGGKGKDGGAGKGVVEMDEPKPPTVVILQEGVVGSLDYKVIAASRADDLYKWLKDHKYHYSGDEATLNFYVQQQWVFTVMKIDTLQMKKERDGKYAGDVTPTRFQFMSAQLVYPLKITQISVKDKTEALFYVQAPFKVDLQGDMSFQRTWVPMLESSGKKPARGVKQPPAPPIPTPVKPTPAQIDVILPDENAQVWFDDNVTKSRGTTRTYTTPDLGPLQGYRYTLKAEWTSATGKPVSSEVILSLTAGLRVLVDFRQQPPTMKIQSPPGQAAPNLSLPGRGGEWLAAIQNQIPALLARNQELGYEFVANQRPAPNAKGHTPTTMEWARKLTDADIAILKGTLPYCEKVPDVDEGFTQQDVQDNDKRAAVIKVIQDRLAKARESHPNGYLVRYVPPDDIKALAGLTGHLQGGLWITKFRKIFCRDEMNADLVIVPARLGDHDDFSEYTEILPTSPP